MRLFLFVLLVLVCLVAEGEARRGRSRIRKAFEKLRGNGRGDTDRLRLRVDGHKSKRVKLLKQKIDTRRAGGKRVDANILASADLKTVCRQECEDKACKLRCLDHDDDETCYVTEDSAMCMENMNDGELKVLTPPDIDTNSNLTNINDPDFLKFLEKERSGSDRTRRSIEPDYDQVAIIRLAMYCDQSYMDLWMSFVGNDIARAKEEAENYLTLFVNEMTIQYSSLRTYGYTYVRNGVTRPLDLAILLDRVVFPSDNGVQFNDFSFVSSNTDGRRVFENTNIVNGRYVYSGVLSDFRDSERGDPTLDGYDYSLLITNLDLSTTFNGQVSSGTIGIAWLNSLCALNFMYFGYNTGIVEANGVSVQVASHEMGHGLGANHDGSSNFGTASCPQGRHLMSPGIPTPTSNIANTYSRFSDCTARQVAAHFTRIDAQDNFFSRCLTLTREEEFRSQFCKGPTGFVANSLDQQCKVYTEYSQSVACYVSGQTREIANQCVYNFNAASNFRFPVRCSVRPNGDCRSSRGMPAVNDGTRCAGSGERFCYRGSCVTRFDICEPDTATPAPTTQTPTTLAPTTLAPTTQAPTTQAPTTLAPTTLVPTTLAPATQAPTTQAPTTLAPTTQAPTTLAPTTQAPTTMAPTTQAPTTLAPATQAPTTQAPTTLAPTTQAPTTLAPTTQAPTTMAPTTQAPTTLAPATQAPTTQAPTTLAPTTQAPTTLGPTTLAPTTLAPTTLAPTTLAPTTPAPTTTTTARPTCTCRSGFCCFFFRSLDGACCINCAPSRFGCSLRRRRRT